MTGRTITLGALLSAVAGGVDVLTFTRMGGAFSSIVTGNLVVGGLSIGNADWGTLARVLVAVAAYVAGVAAGSQLTRTLSSSDARARVRLMLLCGVELAVLLALLALWVVADAKLTPGQQFTGLVAGGVAMGLQSAAFRLVALPAVTTTYLTGTLTSLVAGLVHDREVNGAAAVSLAALFAAAVVTGLVLTHAAVLAAVVPCVLLAIALLLATRAGRVSVQ